jgi:small-conductance mechanosensitive channel
MMQLPEVIILGNHLKAWLIALAIAILAFIVLRFARNRLHHFSRKPNGLIMPPVGQLLFALISETRAFFLMIWSIFIGVQWLAMSPRSELWLERVALLLTLVQVAIWGSRAMNVWVERQIQLRGKEDTSVAATLGLLSLVVKLIFYTILILLGLNNLGVNITALVAGLGVGGIAVALAVQNILGDLFASLTIILDKPFVPGDFIVVGDEISGTVEHVGLKTTRIRNISGEQLVCPNANLLQSRIRNFKRMAQRRVVLAINVIYQTPKAQVERIPAMIRQIVEKQPVRFDRCHLKEIAASWLSYELVFIVPSADYNYYMDIQQAIHFEILDRFAQEKIDLAYPTQTVWVQR